MARPKKDYEPLHMKVESSVMERFNAYCEKVGQTKTLAFERIVSQYLDDYEEEQRLIEELKKQKK